MRTHSVSRSVSALQRSAPDKLLSAVLAYRVLEIDGVDAKAKRQFLEDLTMRDADFLVDEFDRNVDFVGKEEAGRFHEPADGVAVGRADRIAECNLGEHVSTGGRHR